MRWRYPDKPISCSPDVLKGLSGEWVSQNKYDGWRMQLYKTDIDVQTPFGVVAAGVNLFTRIGRLMQSATSIPTELLSQINSVAGFLPNNTVLDCEFVGPRGSHKPQLFVFDCLAWNGWLMNHTYKQRWGTCQGLNLSLSPDVHLAETKLNAFQSHFDLLKQAWLAGGKQMDLCEGIVVKSMAGKLALNLNSSSNTAAALKIKYRDIRETRF